MMSIWVLAFAGMAASSASATLGLYPTQSSRVEAAQSLNSVPALLALYGRVYDPTSLGALAMIKLGGFGAVFVALLSIIIVTRHTRGEEESGRQELLGSGMLGRRAPLTAALVLAMGTDAALGLVTALGLAATGLPVDGSFAFGLAWASVGIAFAAVAAVTAQLTTTRRSATGVAVAVLGAVYLLRAIGDAAGRGGPQWLSWLSPVGWGQQFRPYAGNRWWVILLTLAFTVVVTSVAYALVARRDLGSGLLQPRLGPADAAASLASPLALAWRLQRGLLYGWLAGFAVMGLAFGSLASNLSGFFDSPQARDVFEKLGGQNGMTQAYLAAVLGVTGVVASAYGVQAASRLRSEETGTQLEPLLAAAVPRTRWLLSHGIVALAGTGVLLLVAGVCSGLSYAAAVGRLSAAWPVLGAALAQIPAAIVLTGLVVALFGLVPRFVALGWAALAACVLLGEVGPLLGVDQRVLDLSPFAHTPKLPGSAFGTGDALTLALVALVAAALVAIGIAGFRRRDVPIA
jgi:ABC-2 type transport system permease protein